MHKRLKGANGEMRGGPGSWHSSMFPVTMQQGLHVHVQRTQGKGYVQRERCVKGQGPGISLHEGNHHPLGQGLGVLV